MVEHRHPGRPRPGGRADHQGSGPGHRTAARGDVDHREGAVHRPGRVRRAHLGRAVSQFGRRADRRGRPGARRDARATGRRPGARTHLRARPRRATRRAAAGAAPGVREGRVAGGALARRIRGVRRRIRAVGGARGRRAGQPQPLRVLQCGQHDSRGQCHRRDTGPDVATDGAAPGHRVADPRQRAVLRLESGDGVVHQLADRQFLGRQRAPGAEPADARPVVVGHCPVSIRRRSAASPREP